MSGVAVRLVLAAALAAGLAGCAGDEPAPSLPGAGSAGSAGSSASSAPASGSPEGLPATTVSLSPPGPTPAADRAVIAAYHRFWQAVGVAYSGGDAAGLRAATTEPATTLFTRKAAELKAQRRTQRGPVSLAPTVASRSSTLTTVADCADLREFRTYDSAGTALFPKDPGLTLAEVQLRKVKGAWRVARWEQRPGRCRQRGG